MQTLSSNEKTDWLQLIRTPTIGPITFDRLIRRHKTAAAALAALPALARKAGRATPLVPADRQAVKRELHDAERRGVSVIASCEPEYPRALAAITDRPPVVFVRGHVSLVDKPAIAIVGARNASGAGRKIARTLANDLGEAGIIVVSGLARGIDAAAHEASLATGAVAVVAGGVDIIYPPDNRDLISRLGREGAILSERAIGYQPTGRDFPKRNRLISGLSRGVIVVEAAAKSGTLITARYALEQGREVFAVPGSPLDPRCQGANRLIRDGAALVESAHDVLDVLAQQAERTGIKEEPEDLLNWRPGDAPPDEPDENALADLKGQILEFLSFTPVHRDEIIRGTNAAHGLFADAILDLVLSGQITELTGGRFVLALPE